MSDYEADYYRMTGHKYKKGIRSFLNRHLFHNINYMYWFRKYQEKKGIWSRYQLYHLSRKYGLEISSKAVIGKGLYIGHPYNVTVGEEVIIGENVNLHKGCTVGRTNRNNGGSPEIGDCVYIGINSTVVGNIRIGNDVLIAANSFVNFDVPDHSIVIGNPGVVHHRNNATEGYISFIVK